MSDQWAHPLTACTDECTKAAATLFGCRQSLIAAWSCSKFPLGAKHLPKEWANSQYMSLDQSSLESSSKAAACATSPRCTADNPTRHGSQSLCYCRVSNPANHHTSFPAHAAIRRPTSVQPQPHPPTHKSTKPSSGLHSACGQLPISAKAAEIRANLDAAVRKLQSPQISSPVR